MTDIIKTIFENLNTPLGSMILLGIVGYLWLRYPFRNALVKKIDALFKRIDRAVERITRIEKVTIGNNEVQQIILSSLSKTKVLSLNDLIEITKSKDAQIESLLQEEEKTENPLGREEVKDLRRLYQQIKQGQPLSLPEAQRFNALVDKLKEQRPDHSGTWILAGIAGLVLGFALGVVASSSPERP